MMEVDKAAEIIAKGLKKKKAVIAFPLGSFIVSKLLQIMPVRLSDYFVNKIQNRIR